MSSHIIEIQGCISREITDQVKRELILCGAIVDSERTSFNHKPTRLFISLRQNDLVTETTFINKLRVSSVWTKCHRLIKIQRGTIPSKEKNLLTEK